MKRDIPILYKNENECCGCGACTAICPMSAITMEKSKEGFLYPIILAEKCVRCYKCLQVCTWKNES